MFKLVLTKPKEIPQAREMSGWQTLGYSLLLSLIAAIPLFFLLSQAGSDIQNQVQEISAKIPDFRIEDNRMTLAEETDSFIYQAEEYLFFFDPNGEMSREVVENNIDKLNYIVGGGFLEDEIYIVSPVDNASIPYSQLNGLTKDYLTNLLDSRVIHLSAFIMYLTLFVSVFISVMLTNFFTAFIAFLFNRVFGKVFLFSQTWKMITVASTWPFLIFSIFSLFGIVVLFQAIIARLFTLGIYFYGIKDTELPPKIK